MFDTPMPLTDGESVDHLCREEGSVGKENLAQGNRVAHDDESAKNVVE
jgi:hypothetical protein